MRILITTCGVGIGHASRDLALAELLEENNHHVEFASYNAGYHYYKKNNRKVHKLPDMNFQSEKGELKIEDTVKESKDIPYTFIKTMYKEARLIKKIKPDIILADSDYSSPITAKFLNIPCYIITNDLTFGFSKNTNTGIKYLEKSIRKFITEITKGCQKILIPDIPGSIEVPKQLQDKTTYIGPLLHKNTNEIDTKENLRKKYHFNQDEKIILLTVGGSDFGEILIENLCKIADNINADKIIIFTGLEINPDKFNTDNPKIIIKQFAYYLVEWMKLSDLTIALAGHTTSMELLSIKKPNIMIPIKNHIEQERNLQNMLKYDITLTTEINNPEKLEKTINDTLENLENIKINQEEYMNFIKYDGRQNALSIIENS